MRVDYTKVRDPEEKRRLQKIDTETKERNRDVRGTRECRECEKERRDRRAAKAKPEKRLRKN